MAESPSAFELADELRQTLNDYARRHPGTTVDITRRALLGLLACLEDQPEAPASPVEGGSGGAESLERTRQCNTTNGR